MAARQPLTTESSSSSPRPNPSHPGSPFDLRWPPSRAMARLICLADGCFGSLALGTSSRNALSSTWSSTFPAALAQLPPGSHSADHPICDHRQAAQSCPGQDSRLARISEDSLRACALQGQDGIGHSRSFTTKPGECGGSAEGTHADGSEGAAGFGTLPPAFQPAATLTESSGE